MEYQKQIARKIEGYHVRASIHAAGVVMSEAKIWQTISRSNMVRAYALTQYDAHGEVMDF